MLWYVPSHHLSVTLGYKRFLLNELMEVTARRTGWASTKARQLLLNNERRTDGRALNTGGIQKRLFLPAGVHQRITIHACQRTKEIIVIHPADSGTVIAPHRSLHIIIYLFNKTSPCSLCVLSVAGLNGSNTLTHRNTDRNVINVFSFIYVIMFALAFC